MMATEAITRHGPHTVKFTATGTYASGQVLQLPDGRAGVMLGLTGVVSGDEAEAAVESTFDIAKGSEVMIRGTPVYFDAANNQASWSGDFFLGTVDADAASADSTVRVNLNVEPAYVTEPLSGEWNLDATNGLGVTLVGGAHKLAFDAVAEAAMAALHPVKTSAVANKNVLVAKLAIYDIGDNAALDINIGLANGTHATDFESVTEFAGFHLDGNALDINAQSRDGTTTVAVTDTTVDAVDDTYLELIVDARDTADVKLYVDRVRVLSGSTFKLDAATGPLKPIVHLEKTSDNTTADVRVEELGLLAQAA